MPELCFRQAGFWNEEKQKHQCTATLIKVIVCEECHEKTPLDAESINVLRALIKPTASQVRAYDQNPAAASSKYQEPAAY